MSQEREVQPGEERKVIDDAQLKKMLADSKPSFLEKQKHQIVTLALIALNVIIFGVEFVLSGFSINISPQVLVDMGAMYPPYVQSLADLYRFIAPMFLHVSLMHLLFNMVALFSVGSVLERELGKGNFLLLYFISGITGNAVSYLFELIVYDVPSVSAGASTSVFGLFVAVALLGILHKGNRIHFSQYSKGMIGIIAVNVLITFTVPNISIGGHLGGALGGLFAMFMVPSKNLRVNDVVRVIVSVVWLGGLIALFYIAGILRF